MKYSIKISLYLCYQRYYEIYDVKDLRNHRSIMNLSSISIILVIVGLLPLLFQTDTNLFNNNFNISLNNVIQFAYAQQEYEDENNEDDIGDSTIDDKSSK